MQYFIEGVSHQGVLGHGEGTRFDRAGDPVHRRSWVKTSQEDLYATCVQRIGVRVRLSSGMYLIV